MLQLLIAAMLIAIAALAFAPLTRTSAQSGPGDDDVTPAPPSIGADIPVTYFGPAPSSVDPRLVGPVQLLKSGTIDLDTGTITVPLYQGRLPNNKIVWYILTDTSDKSASEGLGLNFSGKLAYAANGKAVREGTLEGNGTIVFQKGTPGRTTRSRRGIVRGCMRNSRSLDSRNAV